MTITIPAWLLWVVGVPLGVVIILLAVVGVWAVWAFRHGVWR